MPPSERLWHEQVTRCSTCPFTRLVGHSAHRHCEADGDRPLTYDEQQADLRNEGAMPSWCPLRAGPRVVKLAPPAPAEES